MVPPISKLADSVVDIDSVIEIIERLKHNLRISRKEFTDFVLGWDSKVWWIGTGLGRTVTRRMVGAR